MYFGDEAAANAKDPVLNGIEWEPRRKTLIAERSQRGRQDGLHLRHPHQGEGETVFFDV